MYAHKDSAGRVTSKFLNRAEIFLYHAGKTSFTQETCKMFCPRRKCKNTKFAQSETVWKHRVNRRLTPQHYIWFHHEEGDSRNEASSSNQFKNICNRDEPSYLHSEIPQEDQMVDTDRMHDMVNCRSFIRLSKLIFLKVNVTGNTRPIVNNVCWVKIYENPFV